jgi:hypothetical protein
MMLPNCMMPDGADPCGGYHELRAENERLKAALGPGATEAWKHLHDEVERLEAKIAYVRNRSGRACEILNEFDNTRVS